MAATRKRRKIKYSRRKIKGGERTETSARPRGYAKYNYVDSITKDNIYENYKERKQDDSVYKDYIPLNKRVNQLNAVLSVGNPLNYNNNGFKSYIKNDKQDEKENQPIDNNALKSLQKIKNITFKNGELVELQGGKQKQNRRKTLRNKRH